jgi:TadE-like protein
MRKFHIHVWGDERGTTALEFAIVGPLFILVTIGIFYLCMCLFVVGSIHYAVEEGARCATARFIQCTNETTIKAYTLSHYYGPTSPPVLVYNDAAACGGPSLTLGGRSLTGSIDYVVDLGLKQITIPIRATACFPHVASPS